MRLNVFKDILASMISVRSDLGPGIIDDGWYSLIHLPSLHVESHMSAHKGPLTSARKISILEDCS